jgi:hypothetical protein
MLSLACGSSGDDDDPSAADSSGDASNSDPSTTSPSGSDPSSTADDSGTDDAGDPTGDPSGDPSGDPTGDPSGDPTGDPDPDPVAGCEPLPPPEGNVVMLGPQDDLAAAIASATTGTTLMLADGTYDVSGASYIVLAVDGVTVRSQSGNPEAVIVDGGYGIGEVFSITADDITIAELTVQRALWHPIHVTGGPDSNTLRTNIYRVRVIDPGQQAIKINASGETYVDDGVVACSHIELTDAGRGQVSDCYTGGIDAHLASGWVIRDNTITGFWCEQGLSEHGVHFWNSGKDTLVERNVITDCARGIGFGLGENGNGTSRAYDDAPCPGIAGFVGHYGGVIRNNVIVGTSPALFASQFGMDSGVALEQACDTVVEHNTVVATEQPFVSMEYRFANTRATIVNNLVTHQITMRDGGNATLTTNLEGAPLDAFVDAATADVHLVAGAAAIDAGTPGDVADDFEGDARDGAPDIGADEHVQ